ncbi:2-oxoacid:acceptor oxidoreductase family protein [Anaeromyxobacter oryzisoli]|uniref:2-oxoacid:acceptor oxidoreductase family protein n=1 Tax=Anaeromyxobacter oryzisoli TaxID=2925408 RepID=UPI001F57237C|nr:2-oxoacid:acceptor oxidoreductase family protein [Anaeromyxobacter sp. SG63]
MSDRIEILLSGHGGQGVVRLGQVLGLAGSRQGLGATMLVSHGTETRGGYVRSQVVLASGEVDSPVVERADCFCAMTASAYERFHPLVRGTLLYDPAVVAPGADRAARRVAVPASATAAGELGKPLLANVIFLGAVSRILAATLDRTAVVAALRDRIPRYPEENARAFELGWELAG